MRTSQHQFDLILSFMEQHGDLSKPMPTPKGRITTINLWEDLADTLNSIGEDKKPTDKWKKVWSDFKNNTKKKAARLQRAATGTGYGPTVYAKLTDQEHRVLDIIGARDALRCDLTVDNAGVPLEVSIAESAPESNPIPSHQVLLIDAGNVKLEDYWPEAGPSKRPALPSPPRLTAAPAAAASPPLAPPDEDISESDGSSNEDPSCPAQPAQSGYTRTRIKRSGRTKRLRTTHSERSDEQLRKFLIQQHNDYMEMKREQNRIRQMEVATQREWQAVATTALGLLEKIVTKYCKE